MGDNATTRKADRAHLIGRVAAALSNPRLSPEDALHPWGDKAERVVDEVLLPLLGRLDLPPRVGEEVGVVGTVRTVETIYPPGHYRITLDVAISPVQSGGAS